MPDLAIVVPTRGRPENIRKVISAWDFTNAWDHAHLVLAVDGDDPEYPAYAALYDEHLNAGVPLFSVHVQDRWVPMVHKLNATARDLATGYFAVGFAGDDHLPQTIGWAERYLTVLREMGSGMVYGDDGYQGAKLCTEWAVTSDVVLALGRMVPADVEHMYCDNSVLDLFTAAGAVRHLPEVRIEHMHPVAGKAESDDQYKRVNHRDQFRKDRNSYENWVQDGMTRDVATVQALRPGLPEFRPAIENRRIRAGSGPRPVPPRPRRGQPVQRSGPSTRRDLSGRTPLQFSNVRAATPEDVMIALADMATQVPADQEIVELGVFQGRTALQLAWGARRGHGAHVTAIDPWDLPGNVYDPPFTSPDSRVWARHWVDSFGYADQITLVQGFSADEAMKYTGKPVGLLYVDGDHTYEGARRDIEVWSRHLAPGAVIAVDDYGHPDWPGVGQAVDALVSEGSLSPIELYHDRLAVTRWTGGEDRPAPELVKALTSEGARFGDLPEAADGEAQIDSEVSSHGHHGDLERVGLGEALVVEATVGQPIVELSIPNLKALAKRRGIVLGIRKDKRDLILQALRDGR